MDAFVSRITEVKPHPNADRLDLAVVMGYICAVSRGSLKQGDKVVYIAPDAQLPDAEWAKPYEKFVSLKTRRVKTVMLRGFPSEGLIIPYDTLKDIIGGDDDNAQKRLGILHWDPKPTEAGKPGLPYGLDPTDQENVQTFDRNDILGKTYLVTRKHDGQSCTIVFRLSPTEIYRASVCTRTTTLNLDPPNFDNPYLKAVKPIISLVSDVILSSKYLDSKLHECFTVTNGDPLLLVIRGEVCGAGICNRKINPDCKGQPVFRAFEIFICRATPTADGMEPESLRHRGILARLSPFNLGPKSVIQTVKFLGVAAPLTDKHIDDYLNAPASDGEGVVLWECDKNLEPTGFSFKIRSRDYDSRI